MTLARKSGGEAAKVREVLQAGREAEAAVPLFATAHAAELMNSMIAQGLGDLDHSGLAALYAKLSGLH